MLSSITENPNRSLFSLFFNSRTSDKGKLPPMISTKMNADSFRSEMESELDLEERGFGGIGITDEVRAFTRNIGMHPETWLDFPIDEEEDLDWMCVFFSQETNRKSMLKFSQETNKHYLYNLCVILLI